MDKRVAARRRFLRVGSAGSTAFVMTVVHQRAFAGGKKATAVSACTSMVGIPDLTKVTGQKALATSAGGTPTGFICRSKGNPATTTAGNPAPIGICTPGTNGSGPGHYSKFTDVNGARYLVAKDTELAKGCGSLAGTFGQGATIPASYDFRLYEKGFCPLIYDSSTGQLSYNTSAVYYQFDKGKMTAGPTACKGP